MLLLVLFALLAGAGTAITPCVLPVLPALLAASGLGGRRRPLGIVLGLASAFTIAIVALAQLVKGVGLASGAARDLAIAVLAMFGIVMLVGGDLLARVEAPLSRLGRLGPRSRGSGFWSGLGVGGALGFVCAPCAGPILAAVTAVSASTGPTARVIAVALAYSAGMAAVMLLYGLGGRALIGRIRRAARGRSVELGLAAVMLLTAGAMVFNLDVRFEEALARDAGLPAILVDPTRSLESSAVVQGRLAALLPRSRFAPRREEASAAPMPPAGTGVAIPGVPTPALPDLGTAPEFTDTQQWFNTAGDRPLTLMHLRGHVVLVDFWTYTCINCLRTLPFLKGLYATYHPYGLEVVGIETPEFTFEQEAANVLQAIRSDGITYPVVQDNDYGTWNAYGNEFWPAEYLIDARGQVRHTQFGEGEYAQTEAAVRELLYQAGATRLPPPSGAHAVLPSRNLATPETYLDDQRAQGFAQPLRAGVHSYAGVAHPRVNEFALRGTWKAGGESITPVGSGASIEAGFLAQRVYLVMTSAGDVPRRVVVLLDGRRIGTLTVSAQRLYTLASLRSDQRHALTVELPPGVSAYDFTFG